MRETMAEVVAERKTQMSPGRMFAEAYAGPNSLRGYLRRSET